MGSQTQVMTSGALLYAKNAQKCQFTNLQLTNFYVGIRAESVSRNARRQNHPDDRRCQVPVTQQVTRVRIRIACRGYDEWQLTIT